MPHLTPPNGPFTSYSPQGTVPTTPFPVAPSLQDAMAPSPVLKPPYRLGPTSSFNASPAKQGGAVESIPFSEWNLWDDISDAWNQTTGVISKWSSHTFTPSQPTFRMADPSVVAAAAAPSKTPSWTERQYSRVSNLLANFGQQAQRNWSDFSTQSSQFFNTVVDEAIALKDKAVEEVTSFFSHIYQFSQGTAKEKQANCGPASAFIIGKNFGLNMPSLSAIRASVGAPRGNGGGAFAITTGQLGRAVTKQAEKEGRNIRFDEDRLSTNVDDALKKMRESIAAGKQVVLLTSNIVSGSRGHYVVINKVNDDGSIEVSDPQSKNGAGRVHSRQELETALKRRTNRYGLQSTLLTFEEK